MRNFASRYRAPAIAAALALLPACDDPQTAQTGLTRTVESTVERAQSDRARKSFGRLGETIHETIMRKLDDNG